MFSATYVINLPRSTERWSHVQRELADTPFANALRFNGIDGRALSESDIRSLQHSGVLADDLSAFRPAQRLGEIGCVLSHVGVLREVVRLGLPSALILEDDIVLAGDRLSWCERVQRAFADVPQGWELWYLYRCFDDRARAKRISATTVIPWSPQGGAAYAVTALGARKLLAALTPVHTAVDRAYARLVTARGIAAFAASPMLIEPGPLASIINDGVANPWVVEGVNRPPEYWPQRPAPVSPWRRLAQQLWPLRRRVSGSER